MIKKIGTYIIKQFLGLIPARYHDKIIIHIIYQIRKSDLLTYAYNNMGILKWKDEIESGENYILREFLSKYYHEGFTFFDVGANIGSYSIMINKIYPNSRIFSFEPNPNTFAQLLKNTRQISNITISNVACGNADGNSIMYTYINELASEHASLLNNYNLVIDSEAASKDLVPIQNILISKIDTFCKDNNIDQIDFLKIDTEGYEFQVLKGASKMIGMEKIKIIQFEFNSSNIISRVFLKDFYDLLADKYLFYRVDTNRVIPLGSYDSCNEIFKFQNILAINKNV